MCILFCSFDFGFDFLERLMSNSIIFNKMKFTAAKSEKGCRFDASYKGKHVVWESEDMTLYDDVLSSNERRSKAACRVVYEKIKNVYYGIY